VVTLLSKGNAKVDLAEVSGIICVDDATWERSGWMANYQTVREQQFTRITL
jgi:hypothetical protein